jgi:hypothetical protein
LRAVHRLQRAVVADPASGQVAAAQTAPAKPTGASLSSVFAGLAFIRSKPAIFGAISLDMFAVLLGGATALLPVFANDILHTGAVGLGCCARHRQPGP